MHFVASVRKEEALHKKGWNNALLQWSNRWQLRLYSMHLGTLLVLECAAKRLVAKK